LIDFLGIRCHKESFFREFLKHLNPFLSRPQFNPSSDFPNQDRKIKRLHMQFNFSRLDFGKIQEVIGNMNQPLRSFLHHF